MFFSTFDLQKGQALPGPPKKGLRQVCHYPNNTHALAQKLIGAPPRFLLTASLGEVEGKRTEKNIKTTSIMHIGFYRSRATPGQRALVNSHLDITTNLLWSARSVP